MSEIRVGMLVEIVNTKITVGPGAGKTDDRFLGHVGRVIGKSPINHGAWYIDGAEISSYGFNRAYYAASLRPINDDDQASWDNEVWEKIGWNPTRQGEVA